MTFYKNMNIFQNHVKRARKMEFQKLIFNCVEVHKSEIGLKSENLNP